MPREEVPNASSRDEKGTVPDKDSVHYNVTSTLFHIPDFSSSRLTDTGDTLVVVVPFMTVAYLHTTQDRL